MLYKVLTMMLFVIPSRALKVSISKTSPLNGLKYSDPVLLPTLKLPVWPVWSGALAQILEWIGQSRFAEKLLATVGGRVVPMQLSDFELSPFLLLAHHSHSFMPLDPFRFITKLLLPEGFPAHPHAGFDTVTITMQGGLKHRDSEAIQMNYGDGDTQWMRAGRGVIHEEMWNTGDYWKFQRIEIFQLWVNLRRVSKNKAPLCDVLRDETIPSYEAIDGVKVRVICGELEHEGLTVATGPGGRIADSPLCLSQVSLAPRTSVSLTLPPQATAAMYIRRGTLLNKDAALSFNAHSLLRYPTEDRSVSCSRCIKIESGAEGLEALLLLGEPIVEPVVWSGPVVEADEMAFRVSSAVFNAVNQAAGFWDYQISDADWRKHVATLDLQGIIKSAKRISDDDNK